MTDTTHSAASLKRTPLFEQHRALGGKMVEFGGWEMPVQYSGILEEHRAVRTRAGLFDVSHMGEFRIEGPGAMDFLQYLVPNNVARLEVNQTLYTQLCRPNGGTIDDCTLYRLDEQRYLLVVNASTTDKDWDWVSQHHKRFHLTRFENASLEYGLFALQGPLAEEVLQTLTATDLSSVAYYHCKPGQVAGIEAVISRTGYTGEDGFEVYHPWDDAPNLWQAILDAGTPKGLLPIGLGARDTLRLEAGFCLYGHELTDDITPLEAGLGWSVKLDKGVDFIGREALTLQKQEGLKRKRVGIEMQERAVPRADYRLLAQGQPVGVLTSGTFGPSVNKMIGLGYASIDYTKTGTALDVEIRGKGAPATVVGVPFYKRTK
ncbi:MAG TPA: glycine cleavage system aminomethyltransferase GcvT [Ktedonobacterales bacterium]|jgi:aminomethyltransferase